MRAAHVRLVHSRLAHGRLARTAAWPTRPSGTCPRSLCPRSLCQRSLCPRSLSPRSPGPQPLGYSRAGVRAQLGGGGGGGATTSVDPWQDMTDRTSARATKAEDRTAEDRTAAAAADTTAVGSSWRTRWGRPRRRGGGVGHGKLNLWCEVQARKLLSAAGGRTRGRLPWADIAQASGRGRECTCKFPPHGRAGHVRCRKRSLQRDRSACR